ncbi:MAG: OsmC family protein [Bacteroidales bacterium]|nr:OsmC family protein [Bacteroidales bacterium]
MKTSSATAIWNGNLKEGRGKISLHSTGYETGYTFASRFENGKGTNPEELIGAAHAACFSMAFSNILAGKGYQPLEVNTRATVSLGNKDGKPAITSVHLETKARIEGIDEDVFQRLAEDAKKNCPVSRALAALNISLNAKLIP